VNGLGVLTGEALRDALRRRIAFAILLLSLLSLLVVESCTSCAEGGTFQLNDQEVPAAQLLGVGGVVIYGVLSLWCIVLAGVLASDHLARTLVDGTATSVLARPVSRSTFALSRLLGTLILSFAAGAILLGGAAFFLWVRYDLALGPAWVGAIATALSAVTTGSLAMAGSLVLPRAFVFLLVFGGVATIGAANAASSAGASLGGWLGAVDRFGPPLGTGIAIAVSAWVDFVPEVDAITVALRLFLWAALGVSALLVAFGRIELR